MNVIPAIDLYDGHAVQLRGGNPDQRIWDSDEPVEEARRWWELGADALHIVDLDRALSSGRDNDDLVHDIVDESPVPVEIGGGLRGARPIRDLLDPHPTAKAIVATRAWKDRPWLDHICEEFPGRILVGLELKHGTIAVEGWTERTKLTLEEGLHRLDGQDLGGVLLTDIDREGKMMGPNIDTAETAVEELDVPIIASGGISTIEHLQDLEAAGVDAAVVGTALYTGDLDFEDAQEALA
ncbi:1-(5-phosphoribosyl)-5-((5-phosphoribosylamino)methylideneamino)imidazole-4-carboxamide isomerase [Thermoplasmatales archaeon SW_10_69_26]|nr:MAG: 1-(5-phosphoribosyl)-5-((5-phosphoribosylamino)methylideneamino)imidazole-4-carboxamide isomerase [Thermoplasmatales archaeon SW_10_69_26]